MAYYLGIDGGGTKTRCILGDESGALANAVAGGSNIVRLGEVKAREALHTVISKVCACVAISPDQIRALCIGAAGAARPETAATILRILGDLIPELKPARIEIVGDTEIALEAAFGAGPGIITIAGTGSIAFGRDVAGRTARAGGWGFAISDEGSGYWIGRSAVAAILHCRDDGSATALTPAVLGAWKLEDLDQLVQRANATPPPDFPRLMPLVLHAASAGDAVALRLLSEAGLRLAGLTAAVLRRLSRDSPGVLPVAVTGSVFRQSALVREVFYNRLQENFPGGDVRLDPIEPLSGALARARRLRPRGLSL